MVVSIVNLNLPDTLAADCLASPIGAMLPTKNSWIAALSTADVTEPTEAVKIVGFALENSSTSSRVAASSSKGSFVSVKPICREVVPRLFSIGLHAAGGMSGNRRKRGTRSAP